MVTGKKVVCFFSFHGYPLFNPACRAGFGGAEVQLYQLATALARDSHYRVAFVVGDFGQHDEETYEEVKVFRSLKMEGSNRTLRILVGFFRLLDLFQRIDPHVIIQRAAGKETGLAALYCRLYHKKLIYMTASEMDCNGDYIRNSGLDGLIYRYGLTHADQIITQSLSHQEMLKNTHGREAPILKNSYPLRARQEGRKRDALLWVGRLDPWKQPHHFFSLAARLPHVPCVMIAPAAKDADYASSVMKAAAGHQNISFIPGLPFREMDPWFGQAKVLVNTSVVEGFPNTFVQAALCGTPIVSLAINPDDFLSRHNCGYCANGDEEKMVTAVEKLLTHEQDWQEKSNSVYEYARENHDLEKNILTLKEIIGALQ